MALIRRRHLRLAAHAEKRQDPVSTPVFHVTDLAIGRRLEWRGISAPMPIQVFEIVGIRRVDAPAKETVYEPGAVAQQLRDELIMRDLADPRIVHSMQAGNAVRSAGWWLR